MISLVIIPFVTILSFVCSNFKGYDQSLVYNADGDSDSCNVDENNDMV